jgi:hemoglobin-like flavoprotein
MLGQIIPAPHFSTTVNERVIYFRTVNIIPLRQMQIIHTSWNHVVTNNPDFGLLFYEKFFDACPHFKKLFPEDVLIQSFRLTSIVSSLIYRCTSEKMNGYLRRLGEKHTSIYGVKKPDYSALGEVFISALRDSSTCWNTEIEDAWKSLYCYAIEKMV